LLPESDTSIRLWGRIWGLILSMFWVFYLSVLEESIGLWGESESQSE
jgi:hypothetical protein